MKKIFGFTLIEMLVVIGIIGITLPAVFAIIFAVIRQQARVYALKQVKREGDFVLSAMENVIRNEASGIFTDMALVNEVCDRAALTFPASYTDDDGDNFYFQDYQSNWFRYFKNVNNNIASESASTSVNLTTPQVQIANFSLSCNRPAAFATPLITISFDVTFGDGQFQEDLATLHYQTQVEMKNF